MSIKPYQFKLDFDKELIVDLFAGGGGASCGIEMALGVSPDIAINHDPEAIALHQENHPKTLHFINDVFEINPSTVAIGRRIGLLWLSPDCKHFSKAKGGKPKSKKIRSLAWVGIKWAKAKRPRVIILENVEEFKDWGPICKEGKPIEHKKGQTFKKFVREFNRLGYKVEYKELRACDYGAPTIRKRFFMIARCDGEEIVWPEPTHGEGKNLKPYRTAAEIIDWSIPSYSIFMDKEEAKKYGVRRPLSKNTMERIAKGFKKFVLDSPEPFIVKNMNSNIPRPISSPLSTILTGNHHYLTVPFISTYYGKTKNSDTRGQILNKPLSTITAGGLRHGLVSPFISQLNKSSIGCKIDKPITTITGVNKHSLVTPYMMAKPEVISAFLHKYYGVEERQRITDPLHTITTKDRFGLVEIKGVEYQVMDIGFRMLTPRELYRGQGFPDKYKIDIIKSDGKPLPKSAQVRMCGNSVPPPLAKALVEANYKVKVLEKVKVA